MFWDGRLSVGGDDGLFDSPVEEDLPRRLKNYELLKVIGRGGMGIVYAARHVELGRIVALKLLRNNLGAFTLREGKALGQLNHANIVKLLGIDSKDNNHYLVMEYIAGGDLQQYLANQPRLPIEQALSIALDLADALTRAHSLDILHRHLHSFGARPYLPPRLAEPSQHHH